MKIRTAISLSLACALCAAAAGCAPGQIGTAERLATASVATSVTFREISSPAFTDFRASTDLFSYALSEEALARAEEKDNFVLSPVSVYTALATASACAEGAVKEELLAALHTTAGALDNNFSTYYRMLGAENEYEDTGYAQLANSIWVDVGYAPHVREACLKKLAESYFCDAFSADFLFDNQGANDSIRAFVKEKTKGLIDQDFRIDDTTVFALVNTLYLKDVWLPGGNELALDPDVTQFENADGTASMTPFMRTLYRIGEVAKGEGYSYFTASTQHGYTLKVLLPDEGNSAEELFTSKNLSRINATKDYGGVDEEARVRHMTRMILPIFEASSDLDLIKTLQNLGIHALFENEGNAAAALLDGMEAYCNKVEHIAKLKVDRQGVEGAAVTIMGEGATAAPDLYTYEYEDFIVDRPFAFLLTDKYANVLFSGVITSL